MSEVLFLLFARIRGIIILAKELMSMKFIKTHIFGIMLTAALAICANSLSSLAPGKIIGGGVFALLIGMIVNPLVSKGNLFKAGIKFTSKKVLRLSIVLMGITLSFSQVVEVGKYSLIVMTFTLFTAFFGGHLFGKLFRMDWKLSSLISAGTGICGGSAIAAIAPVIEADDSDIAYAISATFIFDILMVVLFPIAGRYLGMTDMGFGLWAGTAVNDTSSVVAAGYAFSDAAGAFSVIVKLTRTLSIVPVVLIFSLISHRVKQRDIGDGAERKKAAIRKIFPYFILLFLLAVAIKSTGIIPAEVSSIVSTVSKFLMVMALGAIGLNTNIRAVAKSGIKPMIHGFIISSIVVIVSYSVQLIFGQI